jgi:hypothetical protein
MLYTKEICRVCILKTLTTKCIVAFFILLLSQQSFGQLTDDFADGNFTTNPKWIGDENKFIISSSQLKLQAPAVASSAFLSTASSAINEASWEFQVTLGFNPSSSNYIRVYLTSDSANMSGSLNGYYVMLGNTADEISLYRQSGTLRTKIIDGMDGRLNRSSSSTRVKVKRDASGNWELFTDVGLTGTDTAEGIVLDASHLSSDYFGLFYNYTATRSDKFYVDAIIVSGNPIIDSTPPIVTTHKIISSSALELIFSEKMQITSVQAVENYFASNGLGNPASATLLPDGKTIRLSFAEDFANGIENTLTVSGVKDLAGNEMITINTPFLYFENFPVSPKDVIITEIFADPSPQIKLPNAEYIEIFNRSEHAIDLSNWILTDGNSNAIFPSKILLPNTYLILSSSTSAADFSTDGDVIGLSNFPTLNNDGDALVIRSSTGLILDSVNFSDDWYLDDYKKEGGWSLELIDPTNPCGEKENWIASEDDNGGTPGKQNSVFANKPDLTGPKLLSAIPLSSRLVRLQFNEKLENEIPLASSFQIDPDVKITSISFVNNSLKEVEIQVDSLLEQTLYTITIQNVRDCNQNTIQQEFSTYQFGLPEQPDSTDVVINEILFNPRPTGVDFVEIVNTSSKFFNIKDWSLSNIEEGVLLNTKIITSENILLKPKAYLAITQDGNVLKGEYVNAHEENFLDVSSLPSLNDDEGSVALTDDDGNLLDYLQYTKTWHSAFIKEEEGVSLERVSVSTPAQELQNWKSASSIVGFATPGYINSNAREQIVYDDVISVEPPGFIPIIGQPNFTQIKFQFDQGGYVANVKIFDSQGHLIKQVANNEVLGTEGFFRWDGDRDNGDKARAGYYMVLFEVFNSSGEINVFRKPIVIAIN